MSNLYVDTPGNHEQPNIILTINAGFAASSSAIDDNSVWR
jgi:hypothetical protein